MSKTCFKCGHVQTARVTHACPACGAVYAKVEAMRPPYHVSQSPGRFDGPLPMQEVDAEEYDWEQRNLRLAHTIYALFASAAVLGITLLPAIMMAQRSVDDEQPGWVYSHFSFQVHTFWTTLGIMTTILLSTVVLLDRRVFSLEAPGLAGWLSNPLHLMLLAGLWYVYRVLKGWHRLYRHQGI